MQTSAASPIDTRIPDFISFAAPFEVGRPGMEEIRVAVEPELGDRRGVDAASAEMRFPLRTGKIQRPQLGDEILARDRLLNWLAARAGQRVIYVVAEAGFSKTTLIADYVRRSQLRTFWYRLDDEETDGLVFLRYLVASCRAIDAGLLPRSAALLSETSLNPIGQEAVAETVLAEWEALGSLPSVLVLDDLHCVESVPTVVAIVERIIARAPDGLQIIVASRRMPSLSVAVLRARGQLAELHRNELRFDESETDRLFRDCYHHALEPDVLHELQQRTDGWAASLQLVRTAVDGRSPGQVRAFVNSLSGSEGHLYDYLAEEVVGDLEPELRNFLVATALLEDIEPEIAAVASGLSPVLARRLLGVAEHLGLVARDGDQGGAWRSHPLVREFLYAQLVAQVGGEGVSAMHRRLATAVEPRSWRLAARHWAAAGDSAEVRRVVSAATPTIIGTGDLAAAYELIERFPDPDPNPWFDIIRTRQFVESGYRLEAVSAAHGLLALVKDPSSGAKLTALAAMGILQVATDFGEQALGATARAALARVDDALTAEDLEIAVIAEASDATYESSEGGSLEQLRSVLLRLISLNRQLGHTRHEGISSLNLANALLVLGEPRDSIEVGRQALSLLESYGGAGDISSAHSTIAKSLAYVGEWQLARDHLSRATRQGCIVPADTLGEAAELECLYGDLSRGRAFLKRALASEGARDDSYCRYVAARVAIQEGDPVRALNLLSDVSTLSIQPGLESSRVALDLQIRATVSPTDPELPEAFAFALEGAMRQQAWFWWKCIGLTQALVSPPDDLVEHLVASSAEEAAYLSIQAELVARRLSDLDNRAFELVAKEATSRPERWRGALRQTMRARALEAKNVRRVAEMLELVGDADDVDTLVAIRKDKSMRLPDAGRSLSRRLAPRIYVEDLGRVSVRIGERSIPGTEVRKKVLSLLCYLLTRPHFTATREQALEALWPDMDPGAGANSLNQSAYFLRQVLEPASDDDHSAGYLRSRSDLIWLDQDLVRCRSSECARIIDLMRLDHSPQLVTQLAETYSGPYAVDLMYDDWASSFRETLHASYLDRVERAITADTAAGAFDRALSVAQLALRADPDAEQIELCLLRLYRRMGANAAAAEQYAHYASVMRGELGMEPPPLESI
jgi:ATP/maltotriose-dependent transcriptional regulator MalT/DNA-binding SARP family transcriptional activator